MIIKSKSTHTIYPNVRLENDHYYDKDIDSYPSLKDPIEIHVTMADRLYTEKEWLENFPWKKCKNKNNIEIGKKYLVTNGKSITIATYQKYSKRKYQWIDAESKKWLVNNHKKSTITHYAEMPNVPAPLS